MADQTISVKKGALSSTSMRYHELAVQRWLNHLFKVREGYPCPVVFATPMDAFASFTKLWSQDKNPFQYLLDARDDEGQPLYLPYPAPLRYPLLSVYRKGWKYRSYQNFSIHRWRHLNWPTVNKDVCRSQLGNVTTSRMPIAWDYRFQINHFCSRPDTQAFFIETLMQEFWRNGGNPQSWILCDYPGWGQHLIRVYLEGDIENATPEEPDNDTQVEFITAFTLVVEGFAVDLDFEVYPALWELIIGSGSVDPVTLDNAYFLLADVNLREHDNNPTMKNRSDIPGTLCPTEPAAGPVTTTGTEVSSVFTGFFDGTLALANTFIATAGTDYSSLLAGFQVGSLELQPHVENGSQFSTFSIGTLLQAVVPGGTSVEASNQITAFQIGTLFAVSVFVDAGTELAAVAPSFSSGTLAQVVVADGSHVENSSQASAFLNGTLTLVVQMFNGTEFVGNIAGFNTGSLVLA